MAMTEDALRLKIADLQQQLEEKESGKMFSYLKEIHAALLLQPELVYILKPEEVAPIIQGLSRLSGESIETPAKKKSAKLTAHTLDDI